MRRMMAIGVAVALSVATATFPQPSQPPRGLRPYLVAVSVANIDDSSGWYQSVLGLRVADRKAFREQGLKIAFLESEGFRLELVELKSSVSPTSCADVTNPAALRGFGKYAFQVDDLGEVVARLRRRGTPILHDFRSATEASDRSIIVKDNDGNWLQFFERTR